MANKKKIPPASDSQKFEFMEMFNQIAILDQDFADRLPKHEFELAFDRLGNIYIDGQPLGINVKRQYKSLIVR